MKKIDLLPSGGKQYKINMHTHSTVSDGAFTPEELKQVYQSLGYDAIVFTDHGDCCPHTELTDENFVALTGVEIDYSIKTETGHLEKAVHINAFSFDPEKKAIYHSRPLDYDLINRDIAQLKADGFLVSLNHPIWSGMTNEEVAKVQGFDAMEISNSIGEMIHNYSDDSSVYEAFLRSGGRAIPVAGDDCHRKWADGTASIEYGKSFVMVKAETLTYEALMEAIASGDCYASTGPKFEALWLEGDMLHVKCDPIAGVYVHSKYLNTRAEDVAKTDSITETTLNIAHIRQSGSPYFWVQLGDTHGGKAWLKPCWFDEI